VKKKDFVTSQDKEDWISFTKKIDNIKPKEVDTFQKNTKINKLNKIDLHGYSLSEANQVVKKFILESFTSGYGKLIIVTGKGSRSKSYENPYLSKELSVLKYSIPAYIKDNKNLTSKISKISPALQRDGGEGALYIFLKKNKNL
jgi:DNA-nicking Smr family endonuclease